MVKKFLLPYKTIYWPLLIVWVFISCSNNPNKPNNDYQKHSSKQQYLFQLLDNYKADYEAAPQTEQKEIVQSIYLEKMQSFLVDSLGRYIDSMTVTVDSVIQKDKLVTTQFHAGDIEFKYGMKFQNNMPPSVDSQYKFMINLSPGKKVTLNFVHLGAGELNFPDDKSKRTMRIFAYPEPLQSRNQ